MFLIEVVRRNLGSILDYCLQMLPCMCLVLPVWQLIRPMRKRKLASRGLVSPGAREAALLVFLLFCAGLAALTLFPANFWKISRWAAVLRGDIPLFPGVDWAAQMDNLQLTPFQEILRGRKGGWVLFLVVANVGIFLPVGFFCALLWRRPRWYRSLLAGLISSCCIEFTQFFIGRHSDVDDILLNTTGALAGFWVFKIVNFLFPGFISRFQCKEERTAP